MPERITQELLRRRAEHNEGELSTLEEVALHQFDIEKIENLDVYCRKLKILYLQHNQIGKIENLHKLKDLEYLNLALNNIRVIENLERCESLRKLDLTVNFVEDLLCVETLKPCTQLRELFLVGNPCASEEGYREFVITALPQLKSLDGREIEKSHRLAAAQQHAAVRERLLRERALKHTQGASGTGVCSTAGSGGPNAFPADETSAGGSERSGAGATQNGGEPPAGDGITIKEDSGNDGVRGECAPRQAETDDFAAQIVPHTPEARLQTARELARRRAKPESKPDPLKPPRRSSPDRLVKPDGRVLQRNEPKVLFRIEDTDRAVVLSVEISKFIDTSLVSLEVKPNYVRVSVKGKVLQLSLAEHPVDRDRVQAQRSVLTGRFVVIMAKRGAEFTDDEVSGVGICGLQDTIAAFAKNERDALAGKKERARSRGSGDVPKRRPVRREAVADYRNIVPADGAAGVAAMRTPDAINSQPYFAEEVGKAQEGNAEFTDDPDVPPLM